MKAPQEEFNTSQWWFKELEKEAEKSENLDFKRAVHGVIRNLLRQINEEDSHPFAKTMILTGEEIGDLASAAGFSLPPEAWPDADELETEYTVVETQPEAHVLNDQNEQEHYVHIAFITDYPDEGTFPLGKKQEVKNG